jgi:tRNA threonylcarbamoyladenosine biosynthesis protein TsaE
VKSRIYHTESEEETVALGEKLAAELPARAVVLLIGQLGAGKTTLAKGIVKGLGAAKPEDVSSPTFTLIHEYVPLAHARGSETPPLADARGSETPPLAHARGSETPPLAHARGSETTLQNRDREGALVYHIDLYRLDTAAQVSTLGLDEIFDRPAIVLIEWGERFPELMPEDRIEIRLRATEENSREIEVRSTMKIPLPLQGSE